MKVTIAVDFDGTIVTHAFPEIGDEVPDALRYLKQLQADGHTIILYTMRGNKLQRKYLDEATAWLKERGFTPDFVNENPSQHEWTDSPKVHADFVIDDRSIGVPLMWHKGHAVVRWTGVMCDLRNRLHSIKPITDTEQ